MSLTSEAPEDVQVFLNDKQYGSLLITGDQHGHIGCRSIERISTSVLCKDWRKNILIVCGDFGVLQWPNEEPSYEKQMIAYYEQFPFTTLYVDGNHENHERQADLPVVTKFGGPVGKISSKIYHLRRGYVYNILGYTIFTFGGAKSHDADLRTEGVNIWPEEVPSIAEMSRGVTNLAKNCFDVDLIITHSPPPPYHRQNEDPSLIRYFAFIQATVKYRRWFCGHRHIDRHIEWLKLFITFNRILFIQGKLGQQKLSSTDPATTNRPLSSTSTTTESSAALQPAEEVQNADFSSIPPDTLNHPELEPQCPFDWFKDYLRCTSMTDIINLIRVRRKRSNKSHRYIYVPASLRSRIESHYCYFEGKRFKFVFSASSKSSYKAVSSSSSSPNINPTVPCIPHIAPLAHDEEIENNRQIPTRTIDILTNTTTAGSQSIPNLSSSTCDDPHEEYVSLEREEELSLF